VTASAGEKDKTGRPSDKPSSRRPIYHSAVAEHFEGDFPLFLNRWEEGFELKQHDHAYVEIVSVQSGEGFHYIGDRVERAIKGCLYVLPVGTSHILRPSGASGNRKLVVYNLCIRREFLDGLRGWLAAGGADTGPLSVLQGEPGSYIGVWDAGLEACALLEAMHREFHARRPGFELSLYGSVLQLAVRIARLQERDAADSPAFRRGRSGLQEAMDHIDRHFAEPLTAGLLAGRCGLSARHFIRLFREETGMGFSAYLQLRRVEYACRLLLDTADTVARIAERAGYRDAAHFGLVFRRTTGTTPSGYRQAGRRAAVSGSRGASLEA